MKNTIFSLATCLTVSLTLNAQQDGVTFKKVKPSEHLKEYEVSYFGDKPVIAHNIKPQYVDLHFMLHIFQQDYMTVDSLLGANEIANYQSWYQGYRRRKKTRTTEEGDEKMLLGYEMDGKLRSLLGVHLSPDLIQRFLASGERSSAGAYVSWGGTTDQFQIRKSYSDFLSSKTLTSIKKDLASFKAPIDLLYMGYGALGTYDFEAKTLQLFIHNLRYIKFPETINKNHGSSLDCKIEMNEDQAQKLKEKKLFRALIPIKPSELEVTTMSKFLGETISGRYFMTELNGDKIELIGNLDAKDKIMTIDINSCTTR